MIGLVDCNNFFVSCERVADPRLLGRPVVVLSNNDGCAVSLSNEAKALGIRRGDPYFKIRGLCVANGVTVLSGHHRLYSDISGRVMATLRMLTGDGMEVYSVDEAFICMNPAFGDFSDYGQYVVRTVMEETGIPVSLGVAQTKTLAKVAARFAKKYSGYKGVCVIDTPEKVRKALALMPVGDVWGIGRRHSCRLRERGLNTALQLASLPEDVAERLFNATGMNTWHELHGRPCIIREETDPKHHSITASRSFAKDVDSLSDLKQAVSTFCTSVTRKLRRQGLVCGEVSVFVCTNRFHEHEPQYSNSSSLRLANPTDYTPHVISVAMHVLESIYRPGYGYKRAGVTLSRMRPQAGLQGDLFVDPEETAKHKRLMEAVDAINSLQDSAGVFPASMGDGLKRLTRREHDRG